MKTLNQLNVNTASHGVRTAELEGALQARQRGVVSAKVFSFIGLPLLVLVTAVSAFHAYVFLSGQALEQSLYSQVSLANIVAIDLLLLYLLLAESPLVLVGLEVKNWGVVYLRVLVAFLNGTVLLKDFGPVAGSWTEPLVPVAGSVAVLLLLPFFLIATPATEGTRRRLNEAAYKLNEEIAALKGALDEAVDPELVASREQVNELTLKLTQAEQDAKATEARLHAEREEAAVAYLNRLSALEAKVRALTEDAQLRENDLLQARYREEDLHRLLAQANATVQDLVEKLAQAGATQPVAAPAKAARKPVEVGCEGCGETIVGFGAVGTSRREAPKFGGRVLCGVCREKAKEAA